MSLGDSIEINIVFQQSRYGEIDSSPIDFLKSQKLKISSTTDWFMFKNILSGRIPRGWIINQFIVNQTVQWCSISSYPLHGKKVGTECIKFLKSTRDPLYVIGTSIHDC